MLVDKNRPGSDGFDRRSFIRVGAGAFGAVALGGGLAACASSDDGGGAATATGASGGAGEPRTGGALKVAFGDGQRNDSLDPALQFTGVGTIVGGLVYDTLLRVGTDWSLDPMLAEDWDVNADATRYTFKLRDGVTFHTGKTLDSNDVVSHFRRILDEKVGSGGLSIFQSVLDPASVKAPDKRTVVFELKAPDAFFGVKLGGRYGNIPQAGNKDWLKRSVGTGPFIATSFKPGVGFETERNPNYWQDGQPYLDAVNLVVVPEQSTRIQGLISGDLDMTDPPPYTAFAQLESSGKVTFSKVESGTPYMYDVDGSIKPFSLPDVKRALKMGIDRQKAADIITLGNGTVSADSFVSPDDTYYPAGFEPPAYDPEMARKLLADAGFPDGFKEEVWTTKAYPYLDEGAAFLKDQFADIGVDIRIRSVSNDQYLKAFLNRPLVMDYATPQHPAIAFETFCKSDGGANVSRIDDPQIDKWITEFVGTTDLAKQKELSGEIIRRFAVESAEIIPFHFSRPYPHKSTVQGIEPTVASLIDFRKAWIES